LFWEAIRKSTPRRIEASMASRVGSAAWEKTQDNNKQEARRMGKVDGIAWFSS
jgi:hypothetical protein